ncbi:2754_t:CDS:2 [Funneliformis geosporum]|uniref:2754_t:CDS:1 n=1 Tax=Funneliformis geosporum TaxID=1117311 RepID=A0A9W4SXX9_9GLOM|nr:2754_t:CDS:2 [Funneliformis geosporum]
MDENAEVKTENIEVKSENQRDKEKATLVAKLDDNHENQTIFD